VQIHSAGTSLASHYNHSILLNKHKKDGHVYSPSHANSKYLVNFTQVSALIEFALHLSKIH